MNETRKTIDELYEKLHQPEPQKAPDDEFIFIDPNITPEQEEQERTERQEQQAQQHEQTILRLIEEAEKDKKKKKGKKKWNKLLAEALDDLASTFQYDRLYIGGGNARQIKFKLPPNVKTASNTEGLLGGIKLWGEEESRRRQRPGQAKQGAHARRGR